MRRARGVVCSLLIACMVAGLALVLGLESLVRGDR